jgi:hypothetical protein
LTTVNIPMPVLPALVIVDGDLDAVAKLALHDLDCIVFALLVLASCAVVGRSLWVWSVYVYATCHFFDITYQHERRPWRKRRGVTRRNVVGPKTRAGEFS